MHIIHKCVL